MKVEISFRPYLLLGFMATVALALVTPSIPENPGRWWWGLVSTWELPCE